MTKKEQNEVSVLDLNQDKSRTKRKRKKRKRSTTKKIVEEKESSKMEKLNESEKKEEVKVHKKKKMKKSTKIGIYALGIILGGGSVFTFAQSAPSSTKTNEALKEAVQSQSIIETKFIDKDTHLRKTDDNLEPVFVNYKVTVNKVKDLKKQNDNALIKSKEIVSQKDINNLNETIKNYEELQKSEAIISEITKDEIHLTTNTESDINLAKGLNEEKLKEVQNELSTKVKDDKLVEESTKLVDIANESVKARDEVNSLIKKELESHKELKIDKDSVKKIDELAKKIKSNDDLSEVKDNKEKLVKSQQVTEQKIKEKEAEEQAQREAEEQAQREAEEAQQQASQSTPSSSGQGQSVAPSSSSSNGGGSSSTPSSGGGSQSSASQEIPSGFAYNGYSYPIATFSGWGSVPADGYVYRWSNDPSHYLIERMGYAGGTIRSVGVGSVVYVDKKAYTVYKMESGIPNNDNAGPYLQSNKVSGGISFQTCDSSSPDTTLTIWWAK